MLFLVINISRAIANVAWVTLAIIIFIVLYRLLLRKLKKGRIEKGRYITFHPIDPDPAHGKIQLYFEAEEAIELQVTIYSIDRATTNEITDQVLKKGGNIVSLDTMQFDDGMYFIEAKTPYQKLSKRIEIKNSTGS
ncbi:MAG: hypothetical protein ACQERC_06825 [Bacteroidota bacterium]